MRRPSEADPWEALRHRYGESAAKLGLLIQDRYGRIPPTAFIVSRKQEVRFAYLRRGHVYRVLEGGGSASEVACFSLFETREDSLSRYPHAEFE